MLVSRLKPFPHRRCCLTLCAMLARRTVGLLLSGALIITLAGCAGETPPHRETFPALGTLVTIEIYGAQAQPATAAIGAVEDYLQRIGRDWYAWGDGELGRINAALARGESAVVSAELGALIQRSLILQSRSDGYFDPSVGLLVELWGFDRAGRNDEPPTEARLEQWLASRSLRRQLTVADGTIRAPTPLKLDLGGIAKGTALAGATRILHDHGIDHALIDLGGDLQVTGMRGERRWQIGIRDPRSPKVLTTVELEPGEAIVTSGDYERYFEHAGTRYHHLLDPRSGRPVTHTTGVSVISFDPELADAAATALMAAGPDRFEALAARLGVKLALLVTNRGELLATDAMRARLAALGKPERPVPVDHAAQHPRQVP